MQNIKLQIEMKDIERALGEHKAKAPQVMRRVVGKLASETKKEVKKTKLRGQVLNSGTGMVPLYKDGVITERKRLAASLTFKTYKDGAGYVRSGSFVSLFHEAGPTTILPKDAKYLVLRLKDGGFRKVLSVTLPKREFLFPTLVEYFQKDKGRGMAEAVMKDALQKIYQKAAEVK